VGHFFKEKREMIMAKICGERYWVFDQGFVANSTGTARMFEGKSYAFD